MADIRNRTPVAKKAPANVKNAGDGMRLALAFIKDAETSAREQVKTNESMKDRLKKLSKLAVDEHNVFCAHMNEKREQIKADAENAGYKDLKTYFNEGGKDGQVAASVQVTISLWMKMSVACAGGWQPDVKKPWPVLSKEATEYKQAKAAAGTQKPESDSERKAREAREQAGMVKRIITSAKNVGIIDAEGTGITDKGRSALPDVVAGIVQFASVEELDEIIARLQTMREQAQTARETAAKAIAKGNKSSRKVSGQRPMEQEEAKAALARSAGAPGESLDEQAAKAQAKGQRRERAH